MKELNNNNSKPIAVLDFIRTPYFKFEGVHNPSSLNLIKSCLLALFEKNPIYLKYIGSISFTSTTLDGLSNIDFKEIEKSFPFPKLPDFSFSYFGGCSGSQNFIESLNFLKREGDFFRISGSFDIQNQNAIKKKSLNKKQQKIKKQDPRFSEISDSVFLDIIPFKQAEDWQDLAHRNKLLREEQDLYTKISCERNLEAKGYSKSICEIQASFPGFKFFKEDFFLRDSQNKSLLKVKETLLRGEFSSISSQNSSLTLDGAGFLLLASQEKIKSLGLKPQSLIIDYEKSKREDISLNISRILKRNKLVEENISCFEISETSASVFLSLSENFHSIDQENLNVFGGSLAYGNVTSLEPLNMIYKLGKALKARKGNFGLALIEETPGFINLILIKNSTETG